MQKVSTRGKSSQEGKEGKTGGPADTRLKTLLHILRGPFNVRGTARKQGSDGGGTERRPSKLTGPVSRPTVDTTTYLTEYLGSVLRRWRPWREILGTGSDHRPSRVETTREGPPTLDDRRKGRGVLVRTRESFDGIRVAESLEGIGPVCTTERL